MERLDGKVALVTGSGRNIGRAEAMLLAAQGAKLVINDVDPDNQAANGKAPADIVAQEIRDAGGDAVSVSGSVADRAAAEAAVQKAIDAFGRIDILVNNAGIVRPSRIDQMSDEDWFDCVNVSLTASFYTTRAAARHMIAQRGGVIINTGSASGLGHWGMANYASAKEGLLGFTRTIARDLGEFGIRCNMIRPVSHITGTFTPKIQETIDETARLGLPLLGNRPMTTPRMTALPEHIAPLVVWLCSDAAAHISGQDFFVQGDEIAVFPEPEPIRTTIHADGWTLDAFDDAGTRDYLFGDLRNRFVKTA